MRSKQSSTEPVQSRTGGGSAAEGKRIERTWGRTADCAIRFLLAAILCVARMPGGCAPLMPGLVAASGGGAEALFALLGGVLGTLLFLPFAPGLRTLAAAVLLWAAGRALADLPLMHRAFCPPLLAFALPLTVEGVYLLRAGTGGAAEGLLCAALCALAATLYRRAFDVAEERRQEGVAALTVSVLAALSTLTVFGGFSPGRSAAVLLVLLLAFDRDARAAVSLALCVGLCIDLTAGEGAFLHAALYALGALSMQCAPSGNRARASLCFAVPTLLLTLPLDGGAGLPLLAENALALAVFLLLPGRLFRGKRLALRRAEDDTRLRDALHARLTALACAARELYDGLSVPGYAPQEAAPVDASAEERRNAALRRERDEARRLSARSCAHFSDLLVQTADALPASVPAGVHRAYLVGSALRPKQGEHVSGDSMAQLELDGGTLCLLLSDGMGSGAEAQRESAMAVRLLTNLLRAGVDASPALRTLNGAFCLRAEQSGSFTTVDLLRVSLASGEAALYKYGAAPSYIKRGGRVLRVTGTSLPAGLEEDDAPPEVTHLQLPPGSFFVMVTDGVADSTDDEWLQDLLAGWEGENPQQLASAILSDSLTHRGGGDDGCALTLYLPPEVPGTPV